jgi:hypothetical protein
MFHALSQNYDIYMVFNAANSPAVIIPRLFSKKVAINTTVWNGKGEIEQ